MPQIDLKYSDNLSINCKQLFQELETAINQLDDTAGACKCRAYPTNEYLHSHCLVQINLLKKAHRNPEFMQNCLKNLNEVIRKALPTGCYCSVELSSSSDYYLTYELSTPN